MKKLDQRGVAALEFCLVAVPLFTLMFAIFDFGRYAITMQSLRILANAGARAVMISYDPTNNTYTGCTGDLLPSVAAKNAVPPFLYFGGFTPQLVAGALTVTASSNFTMLMPIWGGAFDAPSASTSIPFCGS
jgi:Flp pilus assembly protein TadG